MEVKQLPIGKIEANEGQIKGLPRNPRFIRDERFEQLKKSIEDAPEMLDMRSLIAVQHGKKVVVICGNMRLRACQELGYKVLPCYVLPATTPVEKLREYTIKDNNEFGQTDWGAIAAEWDDVELESWGVELSELWGEKYSFGSQNTQQGGQPTGGAGVINPDDLPAELQGLDIDPDELPKIQGDDTVAMERIIIVYPKAEEAAVAAFLGIETIDKVVYNLSELNKV